MTPETFFITDEGGHRFYARDIAKRRRTRLLWLLAAIAAAAGFCAAITWHAALLGYNVLAYVVVYGIPALCIWRYVAASTVIREFDRQWAYHQHDNASAATSAPAPEEATAQQVHGKLGEDRDF